MRQHRTSLENIDTPKCHARTQCRKLGHLGTADIGVSNGYQLEKRPRLPTNTYAAEPPSFNLDQLLADTCNKENFFCKPTRHNTPFLHSYPQVAVKYIPSLPQSITNIMRITERPPPLHHFDCTYKRKTTGPMNNLTLYNGTGSEQQCGPTTAPLETTSQNSFTTSLPLHHGKRNQEDYTGQTPHANTANSPRRDSNTSSDATTKTQSHFECNYQKQSLHFARNTERLPSFKNFSYPPSNHG